MIKRWLGYPSVQIVLCVGIFGLLSYRWGGFFMAITSPLLGAAIGRPIMALLSNIRHRARERTWLPVHGQHYVYKGTTIHVLEDEDHCRWVSLNDARKVIGMTATEGALVVAYPDRCKRMGKPEQPHLRDDALVEHLAKENNPLALRFRTWADRNIAIPGRRIRRDFGIRCEPPDLG